MLQRPALLLCARDLTKTSTDRQTCITAGLHFRLESTNVTSTPPLVQECLECVLPKARRRQWPGKTVRQPEDDLTALAIAARRGYSRMVKLVRMQSSCPAVRHCHTPPVS